MFRQLRHRHKIATSTLRAAPRGMTLVEIMIVLTIMASMMTLVGFFAVGALQNSKIKKAETQVGQIVQFLDVYYVTIGEYPQSLDDLTEPPGGMSPIVEEIPQDPWGNDYEYRRTNSDSYELFSNGPDGSGGSEDDIYPGGGSNT